MSEQYPLLCDEVPEEERLSPRFRQRLCMSRARAKIHVKGAAAIITRWPGNDLNFYDIEHTLLSCINSYEILTKHITILLTYWWIGIGMVAIATYILFTCVYSAMLQPTNKMLLIKPIPDVKSSKISTKISLPQVFMHVFVNDKEKANLNNYLPYIEKMTNKYKHFQFELFIVANDTNAEKKNLSVKNNNEVALNMILDGNFHDNAVIGSCNNINIKYVTISELLYGSPLEKHWRSLPHQFIKFLVRAVSIWDKGGIAFDPIVLTPQSPNAIYIDKVYNILKKFKAKNGKTHSKSMKHLISKKINKGKPNPNNIRDIINALENDNNNDRSYQEPLAEVETNDHFIVTSGRKLRSIPGRNDQEESTLLKITETQKEILNNPQMYQNDVLEKERDLDISPKLLPMFLEYIFHTKQTNQPDKSKAISEPKKLNQHKSFQVTEIISEPTGPNHYKPIIISAEGISDKPDNQTKLFNAIENDTETLFEVTIDLKGNIIATGTACHSFVGSMFTNSIHHDQTESVTDFIIKELTMFCKGLFASCVGIDVILL